MRLGPFTMAVVLSLSAIVDDSPPKSPSTSAKPGEIKLFDGKTLEGWKVNAREGEGNVAIVEGAMVLDVGTPMTEITCSAAKIPKVDYELTYESRRVEGNDFFSAATFPINGSYLTFVNGGWGGSVTGLSMLNGQSAAENQTNKFVKYENGRWYRFKVQVTSKSIRCLVDGKSVVAIDHHGEQMATRLETRVNQPLGFATYRTRGAIRDIKVRKLEPNEIVSIDEATRAAH